MDAVIFLNDLHRQTSKHFFVVWMIVYLVKAISDVITNTPVWVVIGTNVLFFCVLLILFINCATISNYLDTWQSEVLQCGILLFLTFFARLGVKLYMKRNTILHKWSKVAISTIEYVMIILVAAVWHSVNNQTEYVIATKKLHAVNLIGYSYPGKHRFDIQD